MDKPVPKKRFFLCQECRSNCMVTMDATNDDFTALVCVVGDCKAKWERI